MALFAFLQLLFSYVLVLSEMLDFFVRVSQCRFKFFLFDFHAFDFLQKTDVFRCQLFILLALISITTCKLALLAFK